MEKNRKKRTNSGGGKKRGNSKRERRQHARQFSVAKSISSTREWYGEGKSFFTKSQEWRPRRSQTFPSVEETTGNKTWKQGGRAKLTRGGTTGEGLIKGNEATRSEGGEGKKEGPNSRPS